MKNKEHCEYRAKTTLAWKHEAKMGHWIPYFRIYLRRRKK